MGSMWMTSMSTSFVDVSDFLGELIVTGSGSFSLVSGTEIVSEHTASVEVKGVYQGWGEWGKDNLLWNG